MGDDEFAAFCDAEYPRLVGAVTLWCRGERAVAEEVCQDALARAYRDWRRVRTLDNPGAWVRRVAMNLATSRYRRRQAERRAKRRLSATRTVREHHDPDTTLAVTVGRALERLSQEQRTVVVLRYYLDLPIAEVAELTRRSPSAVTSLTHRAVDVLRAHLEVADDASVEEGARHE